MGDWIGLAVIGFIVLCAVFAVWQLSKPYDVTVEEFDKRAHEAPSLMSAGLVGLQKILDPATAKAVEAQEDFKEGRFDAEQGKGDGPEPGEDGKQEAVSSKHVTQTVSLRSGAEAAGLNDIESSQTNSLRYRESNDLRNS